MDKDKLLCLLCEADESIAEQFADPKFRQLRMENLIFRYLWWLGEVVVFEEPGRTSARGIFDNVDPCVLLDLNLVFRDILPLFMEREGEKGKNLCHVAKRQHG